MDSEKLSISAKQVTYIVIAFVLFVALALGGVAGCKSFNRYQKRADANNNVSPGQGRTIRFTTFVNF